MNARVSAIDATIDEQVQVATHSFATRPERSFITMAEVDEKIMTHISSLGTKIHACLLETTNQLATSMSKTLRGHNAAILKTIAKISETTLRDLEQSVVALGPADHEAAMSDDELRER